MDSWVRKIHWRRDRLLTPVFLGFLCGSAGKNPPAMWKTWVQSLGLNMGRSPGEGKSYPLQYSGLENSMDYIVSMGSQRVVHDWATFTFISYIYIYIFLTILYKNNYIYKNIYIFLTIYIRIYIYSFFWFFFIIVYYKILKIVPCAIW